LSEESDSEPLVKALNILTKIRNQFGGDEWNVNLEDMEIP
jgi:hypothetical protein